MDLKKIEKGVRLILEGIGEDPKRPGIRETPGRVAKMYKEIFVGLETDTDELLKTIEGESHDEMVLLKDIPFYWKGPCRIHPSRRKNCRPGRSY